LRPALGEPATEGTDGLFGAVEVSEAEGVDDAASWSVEADDAAGADVEFCSVDGERVGVEAVPADGCVCAWLAFFSGERDVVDELVTGKCGGEGTV
jgi:hypothetical protein